MWRISPAVPADIPGPEYFLRMAGAFSCLSGRNSEMHLSVMLYGKFNKNQPACHAIVKRLAGCFL
jgi:hypothetical protein